MPDTATLAAPPTQPAPADDPAGRAVVTLAPGGQRRAEAGHPWVYSNEIVMDAAAKALPAGSLVTLRRADQRPLGVAMFNPHTLLAARLLDRDAARPIGRRFFARQLERALQLRERLYDRPYYRLVHAEADGLPGLVVDRFGERPGGAGQHRRHGPPGSRSSSRRCARCCRRRDRAAQRQPGARTRGPAARDPNCPWQPALSGRDRGERRGLRDRPARRAEDRLVLRPARQPRLCRPARAAAPACSTSIAMPAVLRCRRRAPGAQSVLAIDRSEPALALAARSAAGNGVAGICTFRRGEVFHEAAALAAAGERFDIVVADPPPFARSKREAPAALRGYRKLARLAVQLTAPGGFLFIASCSHNVAAADFAEAVRRGVAEAGRTARILRQAGAGPDHPVHPALPESAYLKALTLTLD